jgi:hypothetical protein
MSKGWVDKYRWSESKTGWHPGYWRKQRKRSGKRAIDKKLTRFRPKRAIRDNFTGEIIGWK